MMTLVIFPMGNNSNIDDQILMIEGGERGGVKKAIFVMTSYVNAPLRRVDG